MSRYCIVVTDRGEGPMPMDPLRFSARILKKSFLLGWEYRDGFFSGATEDEARARAEARLEYIMNPPTAQPKVYYYV